MAGGLITRKKVVAIKTEGTGGTAETLAASEGVMNCYDSEFTAALAVAERLSQGTYDAPLVGVPTSRSGTAKFKTDLIGDDTTAPYWMTHLLTACGFSVTALVATANGSSSSATATVGVYQDGLKKVLAGCAGSLTIPFAIGSPLMGEVEFEGKYSAVSDAAIIAPTFSTVTPPRVEGSTLTIGGYVAKISSGEIKIENTVKLREDITDTTGYLCALIVDQKITVTLDAEAELVASHDAYGLLLAGATGTFSLSVGSAGNKLAFAIPGCQRTEVSDGDRGGLLTHDITLVHTGSTAATITAS